MKNIIPLIVAIILALVSAVVVSQYVRRSTETSTKMINVVIANGNLEKGAFIREDSLNFKQIPEKDLSPQMIKWEERSRYYNQQMANDVGAKDFLMLRDIFTESRLSETVEPGKWAIPVNFENPEIIEFVQGGDDIAIFGALTTEEKVESLNANENEKQEIIEHHATIVVLPQAHVMDTRVGSAEMGRDSVIVLALPPEQANILIAAQAQDHMKLYAALRNSKDDKALNRLDAGLVDERTFQEMVKGVRNTTMPERPNSR